MEDSKKELLDKEEHLKALNELAPKILEANKGLQDTFNKIKEELISQIEYLKARVSKEENIEYVLGTSEKMKAIYDVMQRVSPTDSTVLITGESGVGKEVAALMIHRLSKRKNGPFLAVNCAALSAGLLESELFGHERGAFTGADKMRKGRFELAEGGTLLLDEVSEIDLNLQAKLLRVLQEKTYERVGSSEPRQANVRVIATTNRNLSGAVAKGTFRQDLYYRLNVVPINIPPLRERKEDTQLLIDHFIKRFLGDVSKKHVSDDVVELFMQYNWPGNVRELGNIIERAIVLSKNGSLDAKVISPWLQSQPQGPGNTMEGFVGMTLDDIELQVFKFMLERAGGNKERAAQMLGITSRTLRDRLKKTGIEG